MSYHIRFDAGRCHGFRRADDDRTFRRADERTKERGRQNWARRGNRDLRNRTEDADVTATKDLGRSRVASVRMEQHVADLQMQFGEAPNGTRDDRISKACCILDLQQYVKDKIDEMRSKEKDVKPEDPVDVVELRIHEEYHKMIDKKVLRRIPQTILAVARKMSQKANQSFDEFYADSDEESE